MPWSTTRHKAATDKRGYGREHQLARAAAALHHQPTDPCSRRNDPNIRCRRPLGPMGPWLHYDHNGQRTGYLGFAHAACNRRAGAIEGARRQHRRTHPLTTTAQW